MKDQIELLLSVVRVLDDLQIPYIVVGSVASSLQGFSRATADVDIVVDLHLEQAAPLFAALKEEYYIDEKAIRRAVSLRRSFNIIHFDSLSKIDVYVLKAEEFSRQELERRRLEVLLPGDATGKVYMATPEDTVLSKLRWYRRGGEVSERQLSDVLGVLKVQGEKLDLEHMRGWAERLDVRDLLEQLLKEAAIT
ncbi:MAG TPA: hypothetical protein VEX60_10815 [Pyrinomonadaceae bacterium]|nr:hypothetical protein [Pyrinomonadaceae bacterium]